MDIEGDVYVKTQSYLHKKRYKVIYIQKEIYQRTYKEEQLD